MSRHKRLGRIIICRVCGKRFPQAKFARHYRDAHGTRKNPRVE